MSKIEWGEPEAKNIRGPKVDNDIVFDQLSFNFSNAYYIMKDICGETIMNKLSKD